MPQNESIMHHNLSFHFMDYSPGGAADTFHTSQSMFMHIQDFLFIILLAIALKEIFHTGIRELRNADYSVQQAFLLFYFCFLCPELWKQLLGGYEHSLTW